MSINQPSGSNYNARSPHFGKVFVKSQGDIREELKKAITDHKIAGAELDLYYPAHGHTPLGEEPHITTIHTKTAAIDNQVAEMLKRLKEKNIELAHKIKTIAIEYGRNSK